MFKRAIMIKEPFLFDLKILSYNIEWTIDYSKPEKLPLNRTITRKLID